LKPVENKPKENNQDATTTIKKANLCRTSTACEGQRRKWFQKLKNVTSITWTIFPISCMAYLGHLHAS
jgi:hypothetical protein